MKRSQSKVNVQSDWEVLTQVDLPTQTKYGSSLSRNVIRVCKTRSNTAVMADIRLWMGNRPTKSGVAFHLPELRWLQKVLESCGEGTLERPHRSVMVTKLWSGTRLSVSKRKIRESYDILLEPDDLQFLMGTLPEMITYMTTQSVSCQIPTDFVVGEKVVETLPNQSKRTE